jgi:ketosteroid isomerase-like protein
VITDPEEFVTSWAQAWNAHDVDGVLAHFHEDVTFTSPVALDVLPETGGVLQGKTALRDYWTRGLRLIPDLHFTIVATFVGVSCMTIQYRNQRDSVVNEVLIFDGELVRTGHGTYPTGGPVNPAGLTR